MAELRQHLPVSPAITADIILAALPDPVVVLDLTDRIQWANPAAEQFFGIGLAALEGTALASVVMNDSPLVAMVAQVRDLGAGLSEYGIDLAGPRIGSHRVDIRVSPIHEAPGQLVVTVQARSIAEVMDRQLTHRGAAHAVVGMARLLAHEVKNPLSGIRGAAQLLEQSANESDWELTRLIRDETDRICALVDTMDRFAEEGIDRPQPVNLHEILGRVQRLAAGGFGRHVRFVERYDPSLPPASGDKNALVQVFLNLVKNAAEAVPTSGGEIVLGTAYRQGVRIHVPGARERVSLPLEITVTDNGPGIPEGLRAHLFDAFVTTKSEGSGLGLALVAKLIRDHGGVVEFESVSRHTEFRIRLPVYNRAVVPVEASVHG